MLYKPAFGHAEDNTSIMEQIQRSGIYRDQISVTERDKRHTIFEIQCGDGSGTMTSRQIFEGVELIFNNFQAFQCPEFGEKMVPSIDAIEINYCRKGSFQCWLENSWYVTMCEGMVSANLWNTPRQSPGFPAGHYSGLEIIVGREEFRKAEGAMLQKFGIDLDYLAERLRQNHGGLVFELPPEITGIFAELYDSSGSMMTGQLRLRVLEILLFLTVSPIRKFQIRERYIEKTRQKKLSEVMEYLLANPASELTIPQLSRQFGLSETSLKKGFKVLYGKPLYTWRREYRVSLAMRLLRETKQSISEIAMEVGYENASKFAGMFKEQTGSTPSEFRRIGKK